MSCAISVVIPTYNGTRFLREALESVYAQTRPPAEILLVDDVSTDGTPDLVESLIPTAPVPVRLLRLEKNSGGPAHPINVGVEAATGELIAILDQDDLFLPNKLQEQAAQLTEHSDVALAFSFSGRCDVQGKPWNLPRPQLPSGWEPDADPQGFQRIDGQSALRFFVENACFGDFTWGYPGILFRHQDWKRKGGCDERLRIASDLDLICWLCTQGALGFFPGAYYYRREHEANVCRNRLPMYIEAARVQARYLHRHPVLLQDHDYEKQLQGQFLRLITLASEAGNYGAALQCFRLFRRIWKVKSNTLHALAVSLRAAGRNDMTTRLHLLQARHDELQNNFDHLYTTYIELQANYDKAIELEAHYETLMALHNDLQARHDALERSRDELQVEHDELNSWSTDLAARSEEVQGRYNELEANYTELQSLCEGLQFRQAELETRNSTLDALHEGLQTRYEAALACQGELQAQCDELQTLSNDLAARVEDLQGRHEELQASYASLQARLEEMAPETQQQRARNNDLQCRYDELQAHARQLEASHNDLQTQHAELQARHVALQAQHLPYTTFLGILGQVPRAAYRSLKQGLTGAPSQGRNGDNTARKPVRSTTSADPPSGGRTQE